MAFIKQVEPPTLYQRGGLNSIAVKFDLQEYRQELFEEFNIDFPESLQNAVNKRKAEFLAGRYAAKLALEQVGITGFTVNIGENRQPLWPSDIRGSITHTNDLACCVVTKKEHCSALGLDTENLLNEKTANDIAKNIVTEKERLVLERYSTIFSESCTLAFSAKESLFKALYDEVGQYFDFLDAEITDLCSTTNKMTLTLLKDLSPSIKKDMSYHCFYETLEGKAHTLTIEKHLNL
ncbi:4'-phosphopantetheinyl transferase superfamily protein [Alteromonadaceae bacterium M269]|nr:4'-phosphopantetheinyl transferase superfamily protein [Alteromonadaceae bacterium M269]